MSIDAIGFLPATDSLSLEPRLAESRAANPLEEFGKRMAEEMANVNRQIVEADRQVRELAAGNTDNLHQVMISLEEARLSFQLALQVRNRLLEAYQDVMKMQV